MSTKHLKWWAVCRASIALGILDSIAKQGGQSEGFDGVNSLRGNKADHKKGIGRKSSLMSSLTKELTSTQKRNQRSSIYFGGGAAEGVPQLSGVTKPFLEAYQSSLSSIGTAFSKQFGLSISAYSACRSGALLYCLSSMYTAYWAVQMTALLHLLPPKKDPFLLTTT